MPGGQDCVAIACTLGCISPEDGVEVLRIPLAGCLDIALGVQVFTKEDLLATPLNGLGSPMEEEAIAALGKPAPFVWNCG